MSIIPVGAAEVTARITLVGDQEEMAVVFGINVTSPPFDQADADAVSSEVSDLLTSQMGTGYRFEGVRVTVGNDGGPLLFESTDGNGSGTQSATTAPQNTALLYTKRSALGGRRNRGRMYIPGVGEAAVDNAGNLTSGAIDAANAAAAQWLTNMSTAGYPVVILHSDTPATPTVVTSMVCSSRVASQRRRLRS